jgi:DNA-binding GntR family transcriptional regulator
MFQKVEAVSKKTRVVASLKGAILSGAIRSGEQIVEGKLAQQFGVGQGLIREALIELEHHGLVQRTPFSGTQVGRLSLEDVQQIFDIRIELEPLAVSLAGPKLTPAQVDELVELADNAKQAGKAEDLDQFFDLHLALRRRLWELSGNRHLHNTLERLVIPLYALYLIRRPDNRERQLQSLIDCIDHQDKLMEAYRTRDFDEARRVCRDFLVRMKEYLARRSQPPA